MYVPVSLLKLNDISFECLCLEVMKRVPVPESGDMCFLNEISLLLPKMGDGSCRWPYFFGKLDVDVQSLFS